MEHLYDIEYWTPWCSPSNTNPYHIVLSFHQGDLVSHCWQAIPTKHQNNETSKQTNLFYAILPNLHGDLWLAGHDFTPDKHDAR